MVRRQQSSKGGGHPPLSPFRSLSLFPPLGSSPPWFSELGISSQMGLKSNAEDPLVENMKGEGSGNLNTCKFRSLKIETWKLEDPQIASNFG